MRFAAQKGDLMGVFKVRANMSNLLDRYRPARERGTSVECEVTVDCGAAELPAGGIGGEAETRAT